MPKTQSGIGPRWLALLMLTFAALEIPWLVYLILFQVRTGTAYHTHLAALGMAGSSIIASLCAAVGLWQGARWTPVATSMTATMFVAGGVLGVLVTDLNPALVAVPGAAAALLGSYRALGLGGFGEPLDRWLAVVLGLVAAVLFMRLIVTVSTTPTEMSADHLRALVVLLDTAEVLALGGAGFCLLKNRPAAVIFFGSVGIVLFLGDAWCNVVLVPPGPTLTAAIVYAVVGEFPSTAMCIYAVRLGMRHWRPANPRPGIPAHA